MISHPPKLTSFRLNDMRVKFMAVKSCGFYVLPQYSHCGLGKQGQPTNLIQRLNSKRPLCQFVSFRLEIWGQLFV